MEVLIKGMGLPESCGFCRFCKGGTVDAVHCEVMQKYIAECVPPYDKRMEWCPIIGEIPDRYGRLIDVDKLIASFRKWADAPIKRTNNEIADFLEEYSKDSTIVEATNE